MSLINKVIISPRLGHSKQQVRFLKRRLAYPDKYVPKVPPPTGKKDHASYFQRAIKQFLGPKNIRGEYYRNKYYYPPQNNTPNYIVPDGKTVIGTIDEQSDVRKFNNASRDPTLHPFPENIQCKTASAISHSLKQKIYADATEHNLPHEHIAQKYGIKITRIEAIIRLYNIEQDWQQTSKITPELQTFSDVMYKMFPLYNPPVEAENLTEIPVPKKTLQQRFVAIAESEPFGPMDAAKVFGLEPASETLDKLTHVNDAGSNDDTKHTITQSIIVGSEKDGDRSTFKFTEAKSGDVGFRYGSSRRDRKKDRAIGFDRSGRVLNML